MYDIQIIAPCIDERKELFQKFGLYNIKNRKVLLCCLVDNKDFFEKGWPEGLDVEFIEYPNKNENFKIYDFLYNLNLEKSKRARWTAKIDDDSYNDIDLLVSTLDKKYNYLEDYYLVGPPVRKNDINETEVEILINCGLFEKIDKIWEHELECCLLSQSALLKITNNESCKKIFYEFVKKNENLREGYTDQLVGAAAKLCGIQPTEEETIVYSGKPFHAQYIEAYAHFHPMGIETFMKIAEKLNKNFKLEIKNLNNKLNINIKENKIL